MLKISKAIPTVLAVLIIGYGFYKYWDHFGNLPLSDSQAVWGALGDYMNMFFAAANFIVFLWFSTLVHRYNQTKDDKEDQLSQPLLIISVSQDQYHDRGFYEIFNAGQGAAINIIVSRIHTKDKDSNVRIWRTPIMCHSMPQNAIKPMRWTFNSWGIILKYKDALNNEKITLCLDDQNHTVKFLNDWPDSRVVIKIKEITITVKEIKAIFSQQAKRYVDSNPPQNGDNFSW